MDIRQLNYFISVAENLNFTKAAECHYMTQTAISQQIMTLEKELAVKLFDRDKRSVKLTPAGKVFFNEAKFMVKKTEEAINKTRRTATGSEGSLTIGFQGPNEKCFLPKLIRNFRLANSGVDVAINQDSPGKLQEGLTKGFLDVAFVSAYGIRKISGLLYKTLKKDPLCAILHRDHPLANESKIHRSALANESFVTIDRREAPFAFDSMIHDCMNNGFSPNIVSVCRSFESLLLLVEAQVGIALFRRSLEVYANENLRLIDLEGENEYNELGIAWMRDNPNPAIPLFLKTLDDQLKPNEEN